MEWKRNGGQDSSLMAGRRRGVGAAAARRRGFTGGSAEADMHSLARESRTMGKGLAYGPAAATPVGAAFLLGLSQDDRLGWACNDGPVITRRTQSNNMM
uniref:Uncharacterized protein n=1 Tax=Oryza barthii TaxID=65489 RepID=A0A0D3GQ80_9ORYZ